MRRLYKIRSLLNLIKNMSGQQRNKESCRHVGAILAALQILDSFLNYTELSLQQIVDNTHLTRNRIIRMTGTLQARGYLIRDSKTGTYSLGPKFMSLGRLYERRSDLATVSRPILKKIAFITGESASVYILDGLERIILARQEGTKDIRLSLQEGQRLPLHLGAAGKVLLAFGPPDLKEKVLRQRCKGKLDPERKLDLSKFSAELDKVKTQGYALSFGERLSDAAGIAVPIFGFGDSLQGVLGIAGPIQRFTPETIPERLKLVSEGAAELSWRLGGLSCLPSMSKDMGKNNM